MRDVYKCILPSKCKRFNQFRCVLPFPQIHCHVFPTSSEHCQFKSQPFVSTGKMLAHHPRKTECFMWYNQSSFTSQMVPLPMRFPEEKKNQHELIPATILTFKGTNKAWLCFKEWKMKGPSSKINLCTAFYHLKGSSGMEKRTSCIC